jgi:hypothetical protein
MGTEVGEQLPWPSGDTASQGGAGLDEQFEESLGDFEESMAGGASGGSGDEEIDILDPMAGGSAGAEGEEPLFEEGDLGGEGGMMENQAVAQRAAGGAPGGGEGGEGGQQGGQQGGGEQGEGGADEGSESQSEQSAGGSGSGAGGGAREANRDTGGIAGGSEPVEGEIVAVPEDIGDGRSDDIVLRQIREAAMNESDPVLREKLWDEYRRIQGER